MKTLGTFLTLVTLAMVWPQDKPAVQWFKGNTHTHTVESDGDSTPTEVTRWYKDHGYNFLVLTDHNLQVPVAALNTTFAVPGSFVVIKGEEVTSRLSGKAVHVNGLDTRAAIGTQTGTSLLELLQKSVDAIRREGGVPHINHPNFQWSLTAEELARVRGNKLFEVFNGHPLVNNNGGGGVPGVEAMWDVILGNGILLYGIAVDDAHHFKDPGNPMAAGPGRGWVMVRAERLEPRAILEAMERGDFYATNGVQLTDYQATAQSITVTVKKETWAKYRIQFIGRGGAVLQEALDSPATYTFTGREGYVRAKVIDSAGRTAWCQPVMLPASR
jgi:hypothetical protein